LEIELRYTVIKGYMSLETSVFLTEECIITGNSEELIRITEYLTL